MTTYARILARLNSIERKYGDVALAVAMVCLAITVHGAFAIASLHKHAGLLDAGNSSDIVAQLEQRGTPVLIDDIDRAGPATAERQEINFAHVTERRTRSTTSSTAETVPAKSAQIPRQEAAAQRQSIPTDSVRSIVEETVTGAQSDDSADKPAISALAANEGSGLAPLTVSALSGDDASVLLESAPSSQLTISAVAK